MGSFNLEKRRLKEVIAPYSYLKGGCSQVESDLFSQALSDKTRGNRLKLHQGRLKLDIRKKLSTEWVVKFWKRLPGKVTESSPLEVIKRCVDVVLKDVVQW